MAAHYACAQCDRGYAYAIASCSWCGRPLDRLEPASGTVEAVTIVSVPSLGHEEVPYWCALVRAADGSATILKSDVALTVGDMASLAGPVAADLASVGIIGTGIMGRGLTELLLQRGHSVVWCGRTAAGLDRASAKVIERLSRVMDNEQLATATSLLSTSIDFAALAECDIVIEAVAEEMDTKMSVLAQVEAAMRTDAILTSNTSGLSIEDLSVVLQRPQSFGALHFFNPATRMRLVEIAVCSHTSSDTEVFLDAFARSLGKVPVPVAATPAFAVNRALMPLLNEAVRELEEGVASVEAIDEAIRLGLNHPMGPLALADLIGLDVVVDIMQNLAERTADESYAPRPLLRAMVAEGKLGRKSGTGFYPYAV